MSLSESPYGSYRLADLKGNIDYYPLDILVIGATGVGKSTTLNALLTDEQAKVGYGVDPETQFIQSYMLNTYIRLWDTPGLGDNPELDKRYIKNIIDFLKQSHLGGSMIDLALVLVDAGSRDMGVIYTLLNEALFKHIDPERVLVVVNRADTGMSGRHWKEDKPDETLADFLKEKAESVQRRILEATGKQIKSPLCYSAAYSFNLYALLDYIIDNAKRSK